MNISKFVLLTFSGWALSQNSFAAGICNPTDTFSPIYGACKQRSTSMIWWSEGTAVQMTFDAAVSVCSEQKMRLPTVEEMILLHSDQAEKSFKIPLDDIFWVADAVANQGSYGAIYFSNTQKLSLTNDKTAAVMCVLGEKKPEQPKTGWVDVTTTDGTKPSSCDETPDNCTMRDLNNGMRLKWSKLVALGVDHSAAQQKCETLEHNGRRGWRLPTKMELLTAAKHGITLAIRPNWITAEDLSGSRFWSETEYENENSVYYNVNLEFGFDEAYRWHKKFSVVCVQ